MLNWLICFFKGHEFYYVRPVEPYEDSWHQCSRCGKQVSLVDCWSID